MSKTSIIRSIFLVLLVAPAFCKAQDFHDTRAKILEQFLAYRLTASPKDKQVKKYLGEMSAEGTWSFVNYESTRRGGWPTTDHLKYLDTMAHAYAHPKSTFYQNQKLKSAILKGLNHWLEAGYKSKNWYPNQITAPRHLLRAFLYLNDQIPKEMSESAWVKMLKWLRPEKRTGSNLVIGAEIEVMKGVFYDLPKVVKKGVGYLWSEVRTTTEEGIQPDWCFHQHGNQQMFGNYGLSYSSRVTEWAYILRGTAYELSEDKLQIHSNFLLNGPAWFLWEDKMDLIAAGRQYKIGDLEKKQQVFTNQFQLMAQVDRERKKDYKTILSKTYCPTGHRAYWRSDCAAHREKDWMASLAMSSIRVIGTELTNMESYLGLHNSDGRLLITQTGQEYHHIAPLWDWNRLPGTTCDQNLETLVPQKKTRTTSPFAGSLDDGQMGISSMHYHRNDLSAKKSWFFTKDEIICLGADISGRTKGEVFTSVEQSNFLGNITSPNGAIKNTSVKGGTWVHHNQIGYHILNEAHVKTASLEDNWKKCFPTYDSIPARGDVFSIYINHGKDPKEASYAYTIYPDVVAKKMDETIAKSRVKIVSNTASVQAVKVGQELLAVFHEAAALEIGENQKIEVDRPCLLMLKKKEILVSDPIHDSESINVNINGKQYSASFPLEDQRGNKTIIKLK
ncbi:MAG: polysaccharide lyase family 8 super-sandwich domain-containing protein [Bacteroidota bacterium]